MSDLISRQAAYEVLTEYYHHRTEIQHMGLREALLRVPSIQSKQTDCEFCHEDSNGYVRPVEKNSHAVIYGSVLHLKARGWSGKVQIKYCPMCGRRLTDG